MITNNIIKFKPVMTIQRSLKTMQMNNNKSTLKSWKEIPGPASIPFIGPIQHFIPAALMPKPTGYPLNKILYERYGKIVKIEGLLGNPPLIFIFDGDSAEQVLRGENAMPIRPAVGSLDHYRHKISKFRKNNKNLATGLFSDHGETWQDFRTAMNPIFLKLKTVESYIPVFDEIAQDMIKRLKYLRQQDNFVPYIKQNFIYELNLWSLESIAFLGLGERLNCFDINLPKDSKANQLIQAVCDFFTLCDEVDFQPNLWPPIPTPSYRRLMKVYEEIEDICVYYVQKSIDKIKKKEMLNRKYGLLEQILGVNEHYAFIMVTDMLFGGVHTSSMSLITTLYLLATHPDIQNKLRQEILSKSGKQYLRACMKEASRIMPVATGNFRKTTKEYQLLGYRIPKDITLIFGHQLMCQLEFPRADEFIPERWLVPKDDPLYYGNSHAFAHSPFGFGVRSCLGRRIIDMESEVLITRLLENFHIGWDGSGPNIRYIFVNEMAPPYHFTFKDI